MNYKQIYAIKAANKKRILCACPGCPETSGIYFLIREEGGFKFAYIGQAKHLLSRLAEHLTGYQHIDLSIKKHGLYSEEKPNGWKINFLPFSEDVLDEKEQYYIKKYANAGYQLRNHESGGKEGKIALENRNAAKGYRDGLKQGYLNAQRYVANLFDKHLIYDKKSAKPNKNQEKAMAKFEEFISSKE